MKKLVLLPLLACTVLPSLARAEAPLVSTINWYALDAYCAFQREGAVVQYDDPDTWNWVFFTQFGPDGTLETGAGFVAIRDRLQQLELLDTVQGKDGETRHYRTYGPDPYEVSITMSIADVDVESTDYRGHLSVSGPGGSETVDVEGSCGV